MFYTNLTTIYKHRVVNEISLSDLRACVRQCVRECVRDCVRVCNIRSTMLHSYWQRSPLFIQSTLKLLQHLWLYRTLANTLSLFIQFVLFQTLI